MAGVLLGMPGPWAEDYRESADNYTTKVGGLPDWPLPMEAIGADLLQCGACGNELCLVAQVYAPISSKTVKIEERLLAILGCVMPKCGSASQSWRVLRVQKVNEVEKSQICTQDAASPTKASQSTRWWEDMDDDSDNDLDLEELGRALSEAGTLASNSNKPLANRHTKNFASASSNQRECVADNDMPVVPCFYIYLQEEPSLGDLSSISSNYSSLSIKDKASDLEDPSQEETWKIENYEYDKALTADRTYLKFKKRLDAYPNQCFRYSFGGKPLLAVADHIDPGRCKLCGEPRQFELQLMPPLLYFLQEVLDNAERKFVEENWDWMTLIVYTCSKSCSQMIGKEKSVSKDWIVAEEAVVAQYENSEPFQLDYYSL